MSYFLCWTFCLNGITEHNASKVHPRHSLSVPFTTGFDCTGTPKLIYPFAKPGPEFSLLGSVRLLASLLLSVGRFKFSIFF